MATQPNISLFDLTKFTTDKNGHITLIGGAEGGVLSLNSLSGALTLASTSGTITVTPSGSSISLDVNVDAATLIINGSDALALNLANANVWTALQSGTIRASSLATGAVDAATLKLSTNAAAIDLTNANSWSGLQSGTIRASSLATGAVDAATLKLSSNAAAIDLTHANTWTGVQTFTGITSIGAYSAHVVATSGTSHAYTVLSTDEVLALTTGSSSDLVVNLPAATGSGRKLLLIKVDSGTNNVVATPNGSDTIQGNATVSTTAQYNKIGLVDVASGLWMDLGSGGV